MAVGRSLNPYLGTNINVVGIICTSMVEIGVTDLPKSGGPCPPPQFLRPYMYAQAHIVVHIQNFVANEVLSMEKGISRLFKLLPFQLEIIKRMGSHFYIQLFYKPNLRTWNLVSGPFSAARAVMEHFINFAEVSYFWGWFFILSWSKKIQNDSFCST